MRMKTLPRIDGLYWALVISSTTLGETAGDLISQTLGLGYGGGTVVLLALFVAAMVAEVLSPRQHAWLYWTALTLASIGGTTLSDWAWKWARCAPPPRCAMPSRSPCARRMRRQPPQRKHDARPGGGAGVRDSAQQ